RKPPTGNLTEPGRGPFCVSVAGDLSDLPGGLYLSGGRSHAGLHDETLFPVARAGLDDGAGFVPADFVGDVTSHVRYLDVSHICKRGLYDEVTSGRPEALFRDRLKLHRVILSGRVIDGLFNLNRFCRLSIARGIAEGRVKALVDLLHLFREVIDGGKEQDNTPDTEGECNHPEYSPGDTHFPVGCLVSPVSRVTFEPEQDCQGSTDDRAECRDRHEAEHEATEGENKGGDPETVTGNRNRLHRHS